MPRPPTFLCWLRTVWLALCLGAAVLPAAAQTLTIETALSAAGSGRSFPVDTPAATVTLPDEWARSRPGAGGPVWYRVGFQATTDSQRGELVALYVERACTNLEVFLNGQQVHSGGRMTEPLTHTCNHPQLVPLPAALVRPGLNTLDIKLAGHPLAEVGARARAGGLSALQIGPLPALAWAHSWQTALNVGLSQALGATLLLMGGFMFVLGFINRRESHLAYFGALSVGWALMDMRLWVRSLPFDNAVSEFLIASLAAFVTLAGVQFLLRYARLRPPRVDLLLLAQCALMPTTLVLAGPQRLHAVVTVWSWLFALEIGIAALVHLRTLWQQQSRSFGPMAALLGVTAAAGALEAVMRQTGQHGTLAHLAHLTPPLLFVIVGLRLVQQHGRALHDAESDKAQLEQRVREATAEIERTFRQMAELRVEQVTERERKRIAADLHDDLGAKLLTIVHTSESERISTLAREALEEMRLSVRGLTGKPVRLADALGDWRAEVVSRLAQAGIEGDWEAPEDLPQTLSARAFVQTTRILREATSNIIKHSGATRCSVVCRVADGDFQLVVQDNGEGISTEPDGRLDRGHGMATMKSRAKQLQGQCLVESGPGYGTVIRLTLPLDRALEASAP
jgi:two-component system, NarL family, sensor histidine kinase UhpB